MNTMVMDNPVPLNGARVLVLGRSGGGPGVGAR